MQLAEIKEMIDMAIKIKQNAYAPYSKFRVGAVLLCELGKKYTGCNVENSSFSLTCCAERVAIFKAISEGEKEFKALVLVSDSEDFCTPCGACRQVMAEFALDMPVYMGNNRGLYQVKTVAELLPLNFSL
ncbi:MAG: cytidine deaminase [Peptococcaceae bacterium]|nr:cytidine deaminase [Peptococcaceae bacterium]